MTSCVNTWVKWNNISLFCFLVLVSHSKSIFVMFIPNSQLQCKFISRCVFSFKRFYMSHEYGHGNGLCYGRKCNKKEGKFAVARGWVWVSPGLSCVLTFLRIWGATWCVVYYWSDSFDILKVWKVPCYPIPVRCLPLP